MYKLKKFKTVEELEKAYAELEAAFTRKCQEASQAQTELNRTKQQQEQSQSMQTLANEPENVLVSEQTSQNALTDVQPAEAAVPQEKEGKEDARQREKQACAIFFTAFPDARNEADALAVELSASDVIDVTALYRAYAHLLTKKLAANMPEKLCADEAFLKAYVYTSPVVRSYFERLLMQEGTVTPRLLKARGATILPPVRPKNITEAGLMAKDLF